MYRFNVLLAVLFVTNVSIGQGNEQEGESSISQEFFGEKIDDAYAISVEKMTENYAKIRPADSLNVKFTAKVIEVCQAKGCWMRLELNDGEEAMVKFKNYGFFVPTDIAGKHVVIDGKAFVNQMSVEEQRHYAKDGGKSDEETAKITEPKKTYGFLAEGVLLKM